MKHTLAGALVSLRYSWRAVFLRSGLTALLLAPLATRCADADTKNLRVLIFAGQSNMEGADSKVKDIQRFPPFAGLDMPQDKVLLAYSIGRETKQDSKGWIALQPVGTMVGPELISLR